MDIVQPSMNLEEYRGESQAIDGSVLLIPVIGIYANILIV